jgi:SAM-dependent methyltransferase
LQIYKQQQFFPNILSIFLNPFFFFRLRLAQAMKKYAGELKGKLLDFGCGSKPYEKLFQNVDDYIGVDVENESHTHENENVDVYYDGVHLPFDNDSFDSILSNEVLEHVPDLHESLCELHRVLKPGGKILISVPFVCFEHELPYDFRRFTTIGLDSILNEHGFEVIASEKTGSYVEVLVQLWISYLRELLYRKNKFANLVVNMLIIAPFIIMGFLLVIALPKKQGLYFDSVIVGKKRVL